VSTIVDNGRNNIAAVISQNPGAGAIALIGSAVSITIGRRPGHPCP